jgi:transcriptional regulator
VVVHARGKLALHPEAEWLLENVSALTEAQEWGIPNPWRVAEAPPDFIGNSLRAIVGIELKLTSLEGKWKVSQNRTMPEREGVIAGLEGLGTSEGRRMADLVRAGIRPPN